MQISVIRRPASMPPGQSMPASMMAAPASLRSTAIRRAWASRTSPSTKGSRQEIYARPRSSLSSRFLHGRSIHCQQAAVAGGERLQDPAVPRQHTPPRGWRVGGLSHARCRPVRPARCVPPAPAGRPAKQGTICRSAPGSKIRHKRRTSRSPGQVCASRAKTGLRRQRHGAPNRACAPCTIEDIEAGARARIHFEQMEFAIVIDHEIDAVETDQAGFLHQRRQGRRNAAPTTLAGRLAGCTAPPKRKGWPGSGEGHCSLQPNSWP